MMTRKDYIETAEILFRIKHAVDEKIHQHLISEFSEMFAHDNPRFNSEKFADACK